MSATEELRALLDERGVFWEKGVGSITTCVGDWCFVEYPNGKLAATCEPVLTPEQAIAATLGSELMSMRTFDSMETALSIVEKEVEIEELRRENDELCKENEELVHRRAELESATHGTLTAEQVRGTVPSVEWNRIITGLIAAHYDRDEERFKETAVKAAKMYDEAGKYEVSEYIVAQYNPAMAFVPM